VGSAAYAREPEGQPAQVPLRTHVRPDADIDEHANVLGGLQKAAQVGAGRVEVVLVVDAVKSRFVEVPERVYLDVVHAGGEHLLQNRVPALRLDAGVMNGATEEEGATAVDDEAANRICQRFQVV
jgi:hypothetical protein